MRTTKSNQSTVTESNGQIAPGTRNVPKEVAKKNLATLFHILETGFREMKPSEAQFYSSILIHQSLMPEKADNDEKFVANVVGRVMDQSILLTQIYEAWQVVKATNLEIRKEVGHE